MCYTVYEYFVYFLCNFCTDEYHASYIRTQNYRYIKCAYKMCIFNSPFAPYPSRLIWVPFVTIYSISNRNKNCRYTFLYSHQSLTLTLNQKEQPNSPTQPTSKSTGILSLTLDSILKSYFPP